MRLYSYFAAGCLCLLSSNSFAGDLLHTLKRMTDADQKQNYRGTFILRKSDSLSALRVTHGVDEKGVWESLEALNGEPRKVLRHNNRIISIYPERKLLTIRHSDNSRSLHQQLPENLDELEQHYSIQQQEDDRIASHPALVVDVMPKDDFRYGYRYWIEKNTGVLLRCDLVDNNGTVVEQMMFTSLDYLDEVPTEDFDLKQYQQYRQQVHTEPGRDVHDAEALQWRVRQLPAGFSLQQTHLRYLNPELATAGRNAVQPPDLLHLVYSDGLASVSVFIEKNQGDNKHLQGASSMGAVNAYGQPVGEYFVTVVGDVPMQTVKTIARTIEHIR